MTRGKWPFGELPRAPCKTQPACTDRDLPSNREVHRRQLVRVNTKNSLTDSQQRTTVRRKRQCLGGGRDAEADWGGGPGERLYGECRRCDCRAELERALVE